MKILNVIPTLETGGAECFTVYLTNELVRQGYNCDIVTLFDVNSDNELLKKLSPKSHFYSLHKKLGFDLRCFYRLYKFIKKGEYDVVHAHVGAIHYILLSTLLLKNVKFVATIHSEARREAGKNIMKWIRFYMFRHNKCIPVTISLESKISFDEYYNMDALLVYNGVSEYTGSGIPSLRDNEEQIIFVFFASCQPVKNQKLLIRAFAKLVKEYPNSKMLWLGRNTTYKSLYDALLPLMVEQFKYIGTVPNVRDYLVQADAMCLSSQMEGMPITIIEAFSVGCPVLCTPVGGIVNMIEDGKNGLLSNNLSVENYYLMLKRFCELSSAQKKQMRQNSHESFAKYSICNTAKGYLQVYKTK